MYQVTEDLCLTRDHQRAVPITDAEAFSLLVPAGGALSDAEAALYGLATVLLEADATPVAEVPASVPTGTRKRRATT